MTYFIDFLDAPNDLDAALQARMERQKIIYSGDHRFIVVLEENTLRSRVGAQARALITRAMTDLTDDWTENDR